MRPAERVLFSGAIAYLMVTAWAMTHLAYDLWGALIVIPLILAVTWPVLRRLFATTHPQLLPVLVVGLIAKLAGSFVRYKISFDAYGGLSDAQQYHYSGSILAQQIRSGEATLFALLPRETGTAFIQTLTGDIYTVFGSSRLAGFMLFGWMGYWGAIFSLRAAMVAVPGLALRRYAVLLFLLPTMIYWPSSIGKEAWMCLCLGFASYGGAQVLANGARFGAVVQTIVGLIGASFVRPHFGAIWTAGIVVALIAGLFGGGSRTAGKSRFAMFLLVGVATIGLVAVATVTLKYLNPAAGEDTTEPVGDRITQIFDRTELNTNQGGSSFEVIPIDTPLDMPYAIYRTLTRPLLNEARSLAELLPAVEMTGLVVFGIFSWRRLRNLPHMLRRTPFLVFAFVVLMMFGVAFTSIGNLGILTRQRSLVMPLFVLPLCLPAWNRTPRAMSSSDESLSQGVPARTWR